MQIICPIKNDLFILTKRKKRSILGIDKMAIAKKQQRRFFPHFSMTNFNVLHFVDFSMSLRHYLRKKALGTDDYN